MKCIQPDNGEALTDEKGIFDELAKLYSTLFAAKSIYKLTLTDSKVS